MRELLAAFAVVALLGCGDDPLRPIEDRPGYPVVVVSPPNGDGPPDDEPETAGEPIDDDELEPPNDEPPASDDDDPADGPPDDGDEPDDDPPDDDDEPADDPPDDDEPPAPPATEWCYEEPIFPDADVDAEVAAYGGAGWKSELIGIMNARHPATAWLLDEQQDDSYFAQFSDAYSWSGMVGWLDTLSHEQTHLFDYAYAWDQGVHHALYLTPELILELPEPALDMQRGEIFDDLAPAATDGIYADTYFTGWQGERGFVPLLDEATCYLNEVGAVGSVGEYFPSWASVKDGSVAFLYFIEVYLRVAREEQPAVYEALRAEPAFREAVKLLWLRAHFLLPYADAFEELGVSDDVYRDLMHAPARMGELSQFVGVTLSDSPCIPVEEGAGD